MFQKKVGMAPDKFRSQSSSPAPPASFDRGSAERSLWAVEQRLDIAERELRTQFIRIAQLQAEFDLLLAALRRSPDGVHPR